VVHTQHTQHTHTVHTEAHTSPTRFPAGKISLSLIHTHARAHAHTHTHAPRSPGRRSGSRSGRAGCPCRPATRRTCRGRIGLGHTERRARTSIDIDRHRSTSIDAADGSDPSVLMTTRGGGLGVSEGSALSAMKNAFDTRCLQFAGRGEGGGGAPPDSTGSNARDQAFKCSRSSGQMLDIMRSNARYHAVKCSRSCGQMLEIKRSNARDHAVKCSRSCGQMLDIKRSNARDQAVKCSISSGSHLCAFVRCSQYAGRRGGGGGGGDVSAGPESRPPRVIGSQYASRTLFSGRRTLRRRFLVASL
jgi:hypothetical protein